VKWEKEVPVDHEAWLELLDWRGKEEDLEEMESEDFPVLQVQKENLVSRGYLVLLDRRAIEAIKEMLDLREMKETGEWLEKMDLRVLLVFLEKWAHEDFLDLGASMVFLVLLVFLGLRELQDLKEMRVQLVPQDVLD
jgi:hypothetical protein